MEVNLKQKDVLESFSYIYLLIKPLSVRKPRLLPIGSAGPCLIKTFSYSSQYFMLMLCASPQHLIPSQPDCLCGRRAQAGFL